MELFLAMHGLQREDESGFRDLMQTTFIDIPVIITADVVGNVHRLARNIYQTL
jgi:hypothetical protein